MRSATRAWTRYFDLGFRRLLAVTVHPSGVVSFREKHRRKVYEAHLKNLLRVAIHNAVEDEKKQKAIARAAKRAAR